MASTCNLIPIDLSFKTSSPSHFSLTQQEHKFYGPNTFKVNIKMWHNIGLTRMEGRLINNHHG